MSTTALWILITFAIFFPLGCYLGYKSGQTDELMKQQADKHARMMSDIDATIARYTVPVHLLHEHEKEVESLRAECVKLKAQLTTINDKLSK